MAEKRFDLAVIGGGINGAAIARDAAGRGLKVFLAEAQDYAQGTSSRSSKLIHGGLRYLEQREIHLVRESLRERTLLLANAPHLVKPLRFLLPQARDAQRPLWLLRLGLAFYDILSGKGGLPRSGELSPDEKIRLPRLKQEFKAHVLQYSDCTGDDTRLVIDTLMDARARGADIGNYRRVTRIEKNARAFALTYQTQGEEREIEAQFIVNAAGPWVNQIVRGALHREPQRTLRLVRGSHIVAAMPEPAQRDAFLLQNTDGRVVFVIPWLDGKRLLIGTTDVNHQASPDQVVCTPEEEAYLLSAYNRYFMPTLNASDVLARFSGLRPLLEEPGKAAQKLSRDYAILHEPSGAGGLITVYGGKLTTHRALAEKVLRQIAKMAPADQRISWRAGWTAKTALVSSPAIPSENGAETRDSGFARWHQTYGARARLISEIFHSRQENQREIAPGIVEAELIFARDHEDARSGDDFLYRRSHLGFVIPLSEQAKIAAWFSQSLKG